MLCYELFSVYKAMFNTDLGEFWGIKAMVKISTK